MESIPDTNWAEEGDWELFNDNGFVYRRKKRRLDASASASAQPETLQIVNTESEEIRRQERKRMFLLKLKTHYQREIDQWELLSSTLRETEERTRKLQEQQQLERKQETPVTFLEDSSLPVVQGNEFASVVDELLLQAEAQEAIIQNASSLCDIAEALCKAQEVDFYQSFIDLPIWGSPTELMASLSEEYGQEKWGKNNW